MIWVFGLEFLQSFHIAVPRIHEHRKTVRWVIEHPAQFPLLTKLEVSHESMPIIEPSIAMDAPELMVIVLVFKDTHASSPSICFSLR